MAASCDAPAKTIVEKPAAAPRPRPWATGVAPATRPKGTTPTSIGATAAIPALTSSVRMPSILAARVCGDALAPVTLGHLFDLRVGRNRLNEPGTVQGSTLRTVEPPAVSDAATPCAWRFPTAGPRTLYRCAGRADN